MMDNPHGKGVTFTICSAPVGYAAEYLTRGRFSAIPMGFSLLMSICCILYHFPPLHVLACKFYWKQQKQLVKTTSSFSPRNLAALLSRRACCPPQKKLFLSVVKVVSIYKTSPLYMFYTATIISCISCISWFKSLIPWDQTPW